jgi:hypothetical protein
MMLLPVYKMDNIQKPPNAADLFGTIYKILHI